MSPTRLLELDRQRRRRAVLGGVLRSVVVWVVLAALYFLAPTSAPRDGATVAATIVGGVAFLAVVGLEIASILRAELPELRAAEAVAVVVPLYVVVFAASYWTLSAVQPEQFSEVLDRTAALYFTVAVVTTVGFGDISPLDTVSRNLVTLQMVLNVVLIAAVVRGILAAARFRLGDD